jgi:hypothetical protein
MLSKHFPTAVAALVALENIPAKASSIQWQSCNSAKFNASVTIDCGTLAVPLDYTALNQSDTVDLQLIRAPAIVQPSRGSILYNFGGPGEPDRQNFVSLVQWLLPYGNNSSTFLVTRADNLSVPRLTGGEYDLISFDTR